MRWTLRRAAAGVMTMLALGACGDGAVVADLPAPPPSVSPSPEATGKRDLAAISDYWRGRQAAFARGPKAGVRYVVDRLHPKLPWTESQCERAWFGRKVSPAFAERSRLHEGTVSADRAWTMDIGPLQDVDLGRGVYRMEVDLSYVGAPGHMSDRRVTTHLQVVKGSVRNFVRCEFVRPHTSPPAAAPVPAAPAPAAPAPAAPAPSLPAPLPSGAPAPVAPAPAPYVAPQPSPSDSAPAQPPAEDSSGDPQPQPQPESPSSGGLDFCLGDPQGQPSTGDYFVCPGHEPSA